MTDLDHEATSSAAWTLFGPTKRPGEEEHGPSPTSSVLTRELSSIDHEQNERLISQNILHQIREETKKLTPAERDELLCNVQHEYALKVQSEETNINEIIKLKLQVANQQATIDTLLSKLHNLELAHRQLRNVSQIRMKKLEEENRQLTSQLSSCPGGADPPGVVSRRIRHRLLRSWKHDSVAPVAGNVRLGADENLKRSQSVPRAPRANDVPSTTPHKLLDSPSHILDTIAGLLEKDEMKRSRSMPRAPRAEKEMIPQQDTVFQDSSSQNLELVEYPANPPPRETYSGIPWKKLEEEKNRYLANQFGDPPDDASHDSFSSDGDTISISERDWKKMRSHSMPRAPQQDAEFLDSSSRDRDPITGLLLEKDGEKKRSHSLPRAPRVDDMGMTRQQRDDRQKEIAELLTPLYIKSQDQGNGQHQHAPQPQRNLKSQQSQSSRSLTKRGRKSRTGRSRGGKQEEEKNKSCSSPSRQADKPQSFKQLLCHEHPEMEDWLEEEAERSRSLSRKAQTESMPVKEEEKKRSISSSGRSRSRKMGIHRKQQEFKRSHSSSSRHADAGAKAQKLVRRKSFNNFAWY